MLLDVARAELDHLASVSRSSRRAAPSPARRDLDAEPLEPPTSAGSKPAPGTGAAGCCRTAITCASSYARRPAQRDPVEVRPQPLDVRRSAVPERPERLELDRQPVRTRFTHHVERLVAVGVVEHPEAAVRPSGAPRARRRARSRRRSLLVLEVQPDRHPVRRLHAAARTRRRGTSPGTAEVGRVATVAGVLNGTIRADRSCGRRRRASSASNVRISVGSSIRFPPSTVVEAAPRRRRPAAAVAGRRRSCSQRLRQAARTCRTRRTRPRSPRGSICSRQRPRHRQRRRRAARTATSTRPAIAGLFW